MAAISGKNGSVSNSGATGITNFTVNVTIELLESTSYDSGGNREYVLGLTGASGSFDWNNVPPTTGNIASLSLNTGNNTISGAANISNVTYNAPVGGIVNGRADFTFTGAVTVS